MLRLTGHDTITVIVTFPPSGGIYPYWSRGKGITMITSDDSKVCPCGCGTMLPRWGRRVFVDNAHKQAWYRITKWAKTRARRWVDSLCNGDMSYYSEAYYYYVLKGIEKRQEKLFGDDMPRS